MRFSTSLQTSPQTFFESATVSRKHTRFISICQDRSSRFATWLFENRFWTK